MQHAPGKIQEGREQEGYVLHIIHIHTHVRAHEEEDDLLHR